MEGESQEKPQDQEQRRLTRRGLLKAAVVATAFRGASGIANEALKAVQGEEKNPKAEPNEGDRKRRPIRLAAGTAGGYLAYRLLSEKEKEGQSTPAPGDGRQR